jgi:phosphate starvation-inducible protein PhoH
MTFAELDTIITRLGENCMVYFCGDFNQTDLSKNGMKDFLKILDATQLFDFVEFDIEDIVRSGLVKQYLIAKDFYSKNESCT